MSEPSKKILLVDQQTDRHQQLRKIFGDLNYEVHSATTGVQAIKMIDSTQLDLILASADKEGQGYDVCKHVRKRRESPEIPVVLMSEDPGTEEKFARHQKEKGKADGYVKMPAPHEDLVDWVERLIGLPSPPNGQPALLTPTLSNTNEAPSGDVTELRREIEDLQEQIHFYQKQLDQVSVTGEKEAREMDQLLKELQDDVSRIEKEKEALQEELRLLKTDLTKKDHELGNKEKGMGDLREETERERTQLRQEMESLRATYNEKEEKHKKAQNVLREYYKPKVAKVAKLEKMVAAFEDELVKLKEETKEAEDQAARLSREKEEMKKELEAEQLKSEKIRDAFRQATKVFES